MRYCAYFCEENVWHLCRDAGVVAAGGAGPAPVALERRRVVFISNELRLVPMRHQRAGRGGLVYWDYHVVLLAGGPGRAEAPIAAGGGEGGASSAWSVWDLDCELGLPVSVARWLEASFPKDVVADTAPRFRVVEAARFLEVFSSDRSHMLGEDGAPQQPFPPWPPPRGQAGETNLMRFVDVTTPFEGEVLSLAELKERYPG